MSSKPITLRSVAITLFVGTLAAGWCGCNTPQIPLPPPVIEDLSFALVDAQQQLGRLSGNGDNTPQMAGSTVRVLNLRDQHGVLTPARDDGSFETRVFVVWDQDELQVDYTVDGERSDVLCVTIDYEGPPTLCE